MLVAGLLQGFCQPVPHLWVWTEILLRTVYGHQSLRIAQ